MTIDPKTPLGTPAAVPESVAKLRESFAALKAVQDAHHDQLNRGASRFASFGDELKDAQAELRRHQDEQRVAMAGLAKTLEVDRDQCAQTFAKIREEIRPQPWTPKRIARWAAGSSVLLSLICAVGVAALQIRDEIRGAADKASTAVVEAAKLRDQVGAVQTQGGGLAVELQAVKATVQGEAERSRDLDRKLEKFLDARLRGKE